VGHPHPITVTMGTLESWPGSALVRMEVFPADDCASEETKGIRKSKRSQGEILEATVEENGAITLSPTFTWAGPHLVRVTVIALSGVSFQRDVPIQVEP
jgi:hypothetical protein